jgi:carbamoyltransferase
VIVLGISAFYHDSAAVLVRDGVLVAAAQEERFSRIKHDSNFPFEAITYCLNEANIGLSEIDYVGYYEKPILTFDRLLETYLAFAPSGFKSFVTSLPIWVKEKIFLKKTILESLQDLNRGPISEEKLLFGFHHHSHAASSFYPSPFKSAAILVMDGVGEWATTTMAQGNGKDISLIKEIRFPHSLGLLYSAFTYYLGFKVNEGEYKVMGLAPYGQPKYKNLIYSNLIDVKEDGSFRLNMEYFNYCTGLTMTNSRLDALFGGHLPRRKGEKLDNRHMDIARSVQEVVEEVVLRIANNLRKETGEKNLCMAGGVALNCVANGKILRSSTFEHIWIQPASGDAGGALGVALSINHLFNYKPREIPDGIDGMQGTYLGPKYKNSQIEMVLKKYEAVYKVMDEKEVVTLAVSAVSEGKILGWFQGRMEFGPRSLGNRSILGDARSESMQRTINMKIKYREGFRPFAPAVLAEQANKFFHIDCKSPYMLLVADVHKERLKALSFESENLQGLDKLKASRSDIPSVTHVDNSARVQTVHHETNPKFHQLLTKYEKQTGYGVLINTSFNIRDEPIVCSPEDAYKCFMGTELDILIINNIVLLKEEQ